MLRLRSRSGSTDRLEEPEGRAERRSGDISVVVTATSKIMLHLEYEPQGMVEKAGSAAGLSRRMIVMSRI